MKNIIDLTKFEEGKSKCLGFENPWKETQGNEKGRRKKKKGGTETATRKRPHDFPERTIFMHFNRRNCQIMKKMTAFFNGPPTKPNQGKKRKSFLHTQKSNKLIKHLNKSFRI